MTTTGNRAGVPSAVIVGLRATLGVGVFVGLAPATALAGQWLLPALMLAALVAACGAYGSAELARAYPRSGGGYVYARAELGPWPGRMAVSADLVGKAAAAGVAAGTFGSAVLPDRPSVAALGAIALATAFNAAGLRVGRRTAWVVVAAVLTVLVVVVAACFAIDPPPPVTVVSVPHGASGYGHEVPVGVLAAAGVAFVSFVGFESITAPGDKEPRYSRQQLRVAIPLLVLIALAVYVAVGAALVRQLGVARLSISPAPLHDALAAADAGALNGLADLGTGVAMLSVLVAVLAGLRQGALALAGTPDLPAPLARTGRWYTPRRADVLVALGIAGMMLLLSRVAELELCAGCMLAYYGLTNAAARKVAGEGHLWRLCVAVVGLTLSVIIGISMPLPVLATTVAVVVGGACVPLISRRWR